MIYIKSYTEPPIDIKEIQRYANCKDCFLEEIKGCLSEISGKLSYRVCYTELPVDCEPVSNWMKSSNALRINLDRCEKIVLFAAGIGIEIDRFISRYSSVSPSKALLFQAIGTERIEALCNAFNEDIKSELSGQGLFTRPRFSPGYGDFLLDAQRDIFRILDCNRKIGVSLNDSLIMSPSKSVTAIIGISEREGCTPSGCRSCSKIDCDFRR